MKESFKVETKNEDGTVKVREYAVLSPKPEQEARAKMHYVAEFNKALNSGAILRLALDNHMRKQGLWSDEQQTKYDNLQKKIQAAELMLDKGGAAGLTKKKAFKLALDMRGYRQDLNMMSLSRNTLDNLTAEGLAENEKFNYLFSECFVYNDSEDGHEAGDKYFKNYEDYKERADELPAQQGVLKFMAMLYGVDKDFQKKFPENKFLLQYKFVDDNLRLIDKNGDFVDENGKRVDKDGYYINSKNERVDLDGNLVDKDGNYIVKFEPFLDDDDDKESKVDNEVEENS